MNLASIYSCVVDTFVKISGIERKLVKLNMDLLQGFSDLKASLAALADDLTAGFATIQKTIDDLKGSPVPVTGDDLENLSAQVATMKSGFDAFVSKNTPEPPPPAA